MDITFENLGFIKKGNIKTNDITIIFGPNNVGKTYLSYSIYSMMKEYRDYFFNAGYVSNKMATALISDGFYEDTISSFIRGLDQNELCNKISGGLPRFFKDTHGLLKEAKVKVNETIDGNKLNQVSFRVTISLSHNFKMFISKVKGDDKLKFTIDEAEISDEDVVKQIRKPTIKETLSRMQILIRYVVTTKFFDFLEKEPFIITSERTGISLFLKEIDKNRNNVVNTIALESYGIVEDSDNTIKNIIEDRVSIFAEPINHNINVIRDSFGTARKITMEKKDVSKYKKIMSTLMELVGGNYKLLNEDILFLAKSPNGESISIPMSMTSGAGKSMFLMDVFLRRYMSKNSYLIIDEPELNLHPKNQIKMAELLVRLSNYGVKVIITTHSDYIVKEINNRIMASSVHDSSVLSKLGYDSIDLISHDKVNAFTISSEGVISEVDKDEFGINARLFDEAILDVDSRSEILIGNLMAGVKDD